MANSTVSQVLHPETGAVIALEIVANNGAVYFVASDPFWRGLRVGAFPSGPMGKPLERVEIARLEQEPPHDRCSLCSL